MEKISKHNYEIFILDFIEGNLSEERASELMLFLEKNPDLKKEAEGIENIRLNPENNIVFEKKDALLKKTKAEAYEISEFDYLCVADLEKDITDEEKKLLKKQLHKDKNNNTYKVFRNTLLQADRGILFPNKNRLKKQYSIRFTLINTIAAAAVIALFLVFRGSNSTQVLRQANKLHTSVEIPGIKIPELSKQLENKKDIEINKSAKSIKNVHRQTIDSSNKNVFAFEEKEPQNNRNLYKEISVSIPDIKKEALFSNRAKDIVLERNQSDIVLNSTKKARFWRYAEKGIHIWKIITKDEDIELRNKYLENGKLSELNFIASNFQFRKTFKSKINGN